MKCPKLLLFYGGGIAVPCQADEETSLAAGLAGAGACGLACWGGLGGRSERVRFVAKRDVDGPRKCPGLPSHACWSDSEPCMQLPL